MKTNKTTNITGNHQKTTQARIHSTIRKWIAAAALLLAVAFPQFIHAADLPTAVVVNGQTLPEYASNTGVYIADYSTDEEGNSTGGPVYSLNLVFVAEGQYYVSFSYSSGGSYYSESGYFFSATGEFTPLTGANFGTPAGIW